MIKCIAVDDEPLALEQLTGYIARVPFLQLIASCQDAFSAMQVLSEEEDDLMFVDIHMPDLNGLDLVRSLVVKPLIVFTTAYPEYAVEGFKVDAVDYLLKPFEFPDLLKAAGNLSIICKITGEGRKLIYWKRTVHCSLSPNIRLSASMWQTFAI